MPWQDVQLLKMTCRTGPCGGTTCGRVARPSCAFTGMATVMKIETTATQHHPRRHCDSRPRRWLRRPGRGLSAEASAKADVSDSCRITCLYHLERLQPAGARPDLVHLDPVQVKHAEQHVRRPLRVVRECQMPIALEGAVDAANEDHRNLFVRVAVR